MNNCIDPCINLAFKVYVITQPIQSTVSSNQSMPDLCPHPTFDSDCCRIFVSMVAAVNLMEVKVPVGVHLSIQVMFVDYQKRSES